MVNDSVSMLNEYAQKHRVPFPVYNVVSELGGYHCRTFCVKCIFMTHETEGMHATKKEAKKKAAGEMVHLLASEGNLSHPEEAQVPVSLPETINETAQTETNPIGWLQEYCLRYMLQLPLYEDMGITDMKFHCRCKWNNLVAIGSGFRKQVAKTNATINMIQLMKERDNKDNLPSCSNKPDTTPQLETVDVNSWKQLVETIGTTPPTERPLKALNSETDTVGATPPTESPLKALNSEIDSEIDAVDSDSVNLHFQESFVYQSSNKGGKKIIYYSTSFLHELLSFSNIVKPEYEYIVHKAGFKCVCKVITLKASAYGSSKSVAKSETSNIMVRLILKNAEIADNEKLSDEQKNKIKVYLHELQFKEFGGLEIEERYKNEDIVKEWLELRKQFPSVKAKLKKVTDFRHLHIFENFDGYYLNKLRNCSADELDDLVAQGMDFLNKLGAEQGITFEHVKVRAHSEEHHCILKMDKPLPLAFFGKHVNLDVAKARSVRQCIETLVILVQ